MSKRTSGENPTNSDKLATRNIVPTAHDLVPVRSENMGSALVGAAVSRMQGEYHNRLISFIEGTIHQIHTLDKEIEKLQLTRRWLEMRVEAINAGEFTLTAVGFVFNNYNLNEEGRG